MRGISRKIGVALSAAVLSVASGAAFAEGWSDWTRVSLLQIQETGDVWFSVEDRLNPDGCSRNNWVVLRADHPGHKALYAMLLSSKTVNLEFRFRVSGCADGYPAMDRGRVR